MIMMMALLAKVLKLARQPISVVTKLMLIQTVVVVAAVVARNQVTRPKPITDKSFSRMTRQAERTKRRRSKSSLHVDSLKSSSPNNIECFPTLSITSRLLFIFILRTLPVLYSSTTALRTLLYFIYIQSTIYIFYKNSNNKSTAPSSLLYSTHQRNSTEGTAL